MTVAHNLYIHVPFCASKCRYCAFYSAAVKPDWDIYAAGICREIDDWRLKLGKFSVPTIFFGGGTPSLMPSPIFDRIMTHIRNSFDVSPLCEITLESNPGTLDGERLGDFQNLGINRLSIGVQSFNDDEVAFLGVENLCRQINEIGLRHASLYELTIEPATPFGKMNLDMPDNDTMADMYNAISNTLCLSRYEVSNYATPGNECQHNSNIWDAAPYIGLGRGAAGRPIIDDVWHDQMGGGVRCTPISNTTRAVEKIITGMRTTRGVNLTPDVRAAIDWDAARDMDGLITLTPDNRLAATNKGILILDEILIKLVA